MTKKQHSVLYKRGIMAGIARLAADIKKYPKDEKVVRLVAIEWFSKELGECAVISAAGSFTRTTTPETDRRGAEIWDAAVAAAETETGEQAKEGAAFRVIIEALSLEAGRR